jgi:DNA-directed RNA polymerase III subunit RPC4
MYAAGSRGGGWFGGGSGGPPGGGMYGGRGKSESKGKGFAEADVRMREARINADKLHVISPEEELDSDDEAMMAALTGRTATTMPMGIYRREHKEQGVVVATTAELEAAENATGEEESLWVDGEGSGTLPPIDQPEEVVWDTGTKQVSIKEEPETEEAMDLDAVIPAATTEEDKKKALVAAKPRKELPKDPEERAIQTDLDLLAGELGAVTVTDEAGETRIEGPSDKDGRLYLFQFPPFLPPLREVAQPLRKTKIKEEGEGFDAMDAPNANNAAVDLTRDDSNRISRDEDDEDDEAENEGFRSQFLSHGGMIGKINVRKSGKVELDWGGMTLEMSPAAGMSFQTTAVIVEENDEKPQQGVIGGESVGMGKIMGRFVLAPIWSEEEDWNVAPEELTTP